jgi:hypothetical protein
MIPLLIMFNPEYCKNQIDDCLKGLLKATEENSGHWLVHYWASALCEWAEQLKKVEKYIAENENNCCN